jgi:hypothetical protein
MGTKRFFIAPLFLAAFAGFGLITMLLWNSLLPGIIHLPLISYWQAVGLLILSRLLFGFSAPWHGHHNHMRNQLREKWHNMSPQQREEFRKNLHHRGPWCTDSKDYCGSQETSETAKS